MPWSAQNSSFSMLSTGWLNGLTGSRYMMKYGLAASSSGPPRSSSATAHMTARSPACSDVITIGLVVLVTIALKLSRYERCGWMSFGCAHDMTKSMLGSASQRCAARATSASALGRCSPVSRS